MTTNPDFVIEFDRGTVDPKETLVADPAIVDRPYRARTWRLFENAKKGAAAGIWEAEPHLERVECSEDEFCHLLAGSVRLTDKSGVSRTFNPGDSFVVAAGFSGTWENLTPVRKIYFSVA